MSVAYLTMPASSCIVYTSVFFQDFAHMKSEFENNLKSYSNHYEIRYDLFRDRSMKNLKNTLQYLNSHEIDYIFTFRSSDKNNIELMYSTAMEYAPPVIDVDMGSFVFENDFFKGSRLMISFHGKNDDDVPTILNHMSRLKPDIYKVALSYTDTGKFLSDLHFVYLYKKQNNIKIAYIPMGTGNSFLRVVSAYIVSDYSYASYGQPTAPGQISSDQFNSVLGMFKEKYE